jgi:hypothetical protein
LNLDGVDRHASFCGVTAASAAHYVAGEAPSRRWMKPQGCGRIIITSSIRPGTVSGF